MTRSPKALLKHFFLPAAMIPADRIVGEIPPAKTVYRTMIVLALPAVAEMLLSAVIQTVDTIMVGGLGSRAIAAVGITGQPRMIALAIFFALNAGITAISARSKGEKNQANAQACLQQGLMVSLLLSILVAIGMFVFAEPLLRLSGANDEMLPEAMVYLRIMMIGLVVQVLSITIAAAQRGVGNTKISFQINLTANLVNVVFNYLLIGGNLGFPRLEVAGAAIASVIGLSVGLVLAILSILKKNCYIHLNRHMNWKPKPEMLLRIWRVGSNAALEQVALRIGFLLFARIVADLGTQNFAVHQVCMQLLTLSFAIGDGMAVAATSLVGQNLGAKRPDMSIIYGKTAQRVGLVLSSAVFFLFFFAGGFLVSLFNQEPYIIETGIRLMRLAAVIQVFQISQVIFSGCLRGAGDNRFIAAMMLLTVGIVRPVFSFFLVNLFHLGIDGAWYAVLIDQLIRYLASFVRFRNGRWTTKVV